MVLTTYQKRKNLSDQCRTAARTYEYGREMTRAIVAALITKVEATKWSQEGGHKKTNPTQQPTPKPHNKTPNTPKEHVSHEARGKREGAQLGHSNAETGFSLWAWGRRM